MDYVNDNESFISEDSEDLVFPRKRALQSRQSRNPSCIYLLFIASVFLNCYFTLRASPTCPASTCDRSNAELHLPQSSLKPTFSPVPTPPQTLWDPDWVRRRKRQSINSIHFIFGLWDNADLPQTHQEVTSKWKELNPHYKIIVWNRDELNLLVQDQFQDWLDIWTNLAPIMQSDLGRYFILKRHGGLYADFDIEPFDFEKCLKLTSKEVILWTEGNRISNGKAILSFKNANAEMQKLREGFGEYDFRVSNFIIAAMKPNTILINRILRLARFRLKKFGATPMNSNCKAESYRVLFLTGPDVVVEATFGVRFPPDYLDEHPEDFIPAPNVEIVHKGDCEAIHHGKGHSWSKNKVALGQCPY